MSVDSGAMLDPSVAVTILRFGGHCTWFLYEKMMMMKVVEVCAVYFYLGFVVMRMRMPRLGSWCALNELNSMLVLL